MFPLFIFALMTLCDPLPTLSSTNIADNSESQVAPVTSKYTTPELILSINGYENESRQSFYKSISITSKDLPLPRNRPKRNISLLPTSLADLYPINLKQKNSSTTVATVTTGDEDALESESMVISDSGDNNDMSEPTSSQYTSDEQPVSIEDLQATSPLLLKLDREYTPREIAEYVYNTGDEKGFAQGVAEMIEDGQIMVSKDDVILFLEAVQEELGKLRNEVGRKEKDKIQHIPFTGAR